MANLSVLPQSIADEYTHLRKELKEGEVTIRGYLKHIHILLENYIDYPGIHKETVTLNDTAKHSHQTSKRNNPLESKTSDVTAKTSPAGGSKSSKHSTSRHLELLHDEIDNGNNNQGGMMRRLLEKSLKSHHWLPWERLNLFPDLQSVSKSNENVYHTPSRQGRHLMDTFGDSLRHVNHLYNKAYGHKSRKVPAHMPHMINREIMQELQDRYTKLHLPDLFN